MNIEQKKAEYKQYLIDNELSLGTITKYLKDIDQLQQYLDGHEKELNKSAMLSYKDYLIQNFKTSTVNNKIITTNKFLKFIGKHELAVKNVRTQTKYNNDGVITQNDYERILRVAKNKGFERDALMIQVFYYTGLRVSELKFFTVDSLKLGVMEINNKGKIRNVPIPKKLNKEAREYIKYNNIQQGAIIANSKGNAISRFTVFNRLKYIAGQARVKKDRVYPHSLRHLFAKNWLELNNNNVIHLADILGHENLETTRIYTKLNIEEMRKTMEF